MWPSDSTKVTFMTVATVVADVIAVAVATDVAWSTQKKFRQNRKLLFKLLPCREKNFDSAKNSSAFETKA